MSTKGAACRIALTPNQLENRGLAWVIGAFLICPCHLPLMLWVAAALLSGTAASALLLGHPYVAGTVITMAWLAATWRGIRQLQAAGARARATMNHTRQVSRPDVNHEI